MNGSARSHREEGFTLLELLLVAVVLAIFAAIAVSWLTGADEQARLATAQASVRSIQLKVDEYRQVKGAWPTAFEPAWFRSHRLPESPWQLPGKRLVNVVEVDDRMHPVYKLLSQHDSYYWYNRTTGVVRIRVPDQGDAAANIRLYNEANGTNITTLEQLLLR